MKITKITIIQGNGADHIILHTDLPEASWPYKAELVLETRAAYHTGPVYVAQHFPDVPVEIVGNEEDADDFDRQPSRPAEEDEDVEG